MKIRELAEVTGAEISAPENILDEEVRISTDTRTIQAGDFYLPLKGESFDGEKFISQALEKGAVGAFCTSVPAEDSILLQVPDTLTAYLQLANYRRNKINPIVVAVTGSSGKTTTINLLTRFYDVEAGKGQITYDGIPINDISKDALRRSLGMVQQNTHLFTGTIRENIRYGNLNASDAQVYEAAKLANADHFIRHLENGYDTVITGDGASLSQGQRQLLAIARAAVADPPVLILAPGTGGRSWRARKVRWTISP